MPFWIQCQSMLGKEGVVKKGKGIGNKKTDGKKTKIIQISSFCLFELLDNFFHLLQLIQSI